VRILVVPVERIARPALDQREARIGELRVLYCAARRQSGDWFALGSLVDELGAGVHERLVSGCGPTESNAVESMLLRAAERASRS
jgi:hypothetical protein